MDTNYLAFGDCPRPKKSKHSEEFLSYWSHLPSLLLHDIFSLLSREDRKSASAVCKHWRENSFHPKWWPEVTFKIEQNNVDKTKFFIYTFGATVSDATIKLHSLSHECVEEFISLLKLLKENNNLKSIIIEPTHCRFEIPSKCNNSSEEGIVNIMELLKSCFIKLTRFSIGCIEDLSYFLEDILKNLDPNKVTHLGLASVKDDPVQYQPSYFNPDFISPFYKLKVLSIDYDQLTDIFLQKLNSATQLERLVVHLHSIRNNHPGTTNNAWRNFCVKHPNCELRLTVIHAFKDIANLHETVMQPSMPLSHLKVFFCEKVNLEIIQNLSNYAETLRSIMWIDSLNNDSNWIFTKPMFDESPDPFVLAAWLCKRLEEFVLYGYKYWEENLVAIGRLRGDTLKKFEIVESDIIRRNSQDGDDNFLDIPCGIEKPWKPIKNNELHPVVCNPVEGDSDEYLLPIVLADLY